MKITPSLTGDCITLRDENNMVVVHMSRFDALTLANHIQILDQAQPEEDEEDEAHDQFGGDQSVMDCNLREAGL